MARFFGEEVRDKNRRKSIAVDCNDPLRFIRGAGSALKESAARQLELAEKNRTMHVEALEQVKVRKAAQEAADAQDEIIQASLAKWSARRRSIASDSLMGLRSHAALGQTASDPTATEGTPPSAIPEEDDAAQLAQLAQLAVGSSNFGDDDEDDADNGNKPRIAYGFPAHALDDINATLATPPSVRARLGRRASSFVPSSSYSEYSHHQNNRSNKLLPSSSSFPIEYPLLSTRSSQQSALGSRRSPAQSSTLESSGYGGSDEDPSA